MIYGFTGTRQGMTPAQRVTLRSFLAGSTDGELHHGDCVGADAQAHDLAEELGLFIVSHPPSNPSKRAWKNANMVLEPRPYLQRNHDIVGACEVLLATPFEFHEQLRSGTWATVRYALKMRVEYIIITPLGHCQLREPR